MGAATWLNVFDIENVFPVSDYLSLKPDSIQSQYSSSPRIVSLVSSFQNQIDASSDLDLIFDNLFWIPTATGASLDVWGLIVGISRTITTSNGKQVTWDDETYRWLIMYKALANISPSDAATMNKLLTQLFKQTVYALDLGNMTIRVVFEFYATDIQQTILENYGLLVRGAGVGWEWYQIDVANTFGFDGSEMQPFNQAPFAPFDVIKN